MYIMYSVTTSFSWSKHFDMVIFNFEDSAVFPLFMICSITFGRNTMQLKTRRSELENVAAFSKVAKMSKFVFVLPSGRL